MFKKWKKTTNKTRIKWLGYSGFEIKSPTGKGIYVDPWIVNNPICPIGLNDIKKADMRLVTHDYRFDHAKDAVDMSKNTGAVVGTPETIHRQAVRELPKMNLCYCDNI